MNHLDTGALRRMIDEPEAFGEQERRHVQTCELCRDRAAALRDDAQFAADALHEEVHADPAQAYAAVRERVAARRSVSRIYPAAGAFAAAAVFVMALLFTPLGTYAKSFLTVFEPKTFQPVNISRTDLRNLKLLPQADKIGTQHVVRKPQKSYSASLGTLRGRVPFAVLEPQALPRGFGTVHSFFVYAPGEATFTFSAAKARKFAKESHKVLPAMPRSLDGTTVRIKTGYVFESHYERATTKAPSKNDRHREPYLEIVQAQAPRVTSTGASLDVLERYILSMPSVPPELAEQIRALSDIQNTVPVPVIIDKQTAQRVEVGGTQGLAIGDNTGLGAGVMWQKNGMIYVVAGPLTMNEVMEVANGLR